MGIVQKVTYRPIPASPIPPLAGFRAQVLAAPRGLPLDLVKQFARQRSSQVQVDNPKKNPPCYPFNLEIFQKTKGLKLTQPLTFFIGENGTGKSTLLKAVAFRCSIHIWRDEEGYERRLFYQNKYAEALYQYLEVEWIDGAVPGSYFDSEIFRYLAECIDAWAKPSPKLFEYFGGDSLLSRSHGQRHLQYFNSTYHRKGLYFLDEPENALSPKKQIELLKILKETSETGLAQFIIVTHSPILLSFPEATIYNFDTIPITETRYEDTDYYRIYKDFLTNRGKYLWS